MRILLEKYDMIVEYKRHYPLKLKYCGQPPYQEMLERIHVIQIADNNLLIVLADFKLMKPRQKIHEVRHPQIIQPFGRLTVFLIYFVYDLLTNHIAVNCVVIPCITGLREGIMHPDVLIKNASI